MFQKQDLSKIIFTKHNKKARLYFLKNLFRLWKKVFWCYSHLVSKHNLYYDPFIGDPDSLAYRSVCSEKVCGPKKILIKIFIQFLYQNSSKSKGGSALLRQGLSCAINRLSIIFSLKSLLSLVKIEKSS